ncbi:MAG: MMPL family transporter [Alphaproteobacteria bacterium]|nr:MMPL family transporter [Alphaproteobacteria bacterium]
MVDKISLIAKKRAVLSVWTAIVERYAVAVITIIIMLSVLAAWYTASYLAINTSTSDMISAETSFRRNAIDYDAAFPQLNDLIVAVIDASSPEGAQSAADRLAVALREKTTVFDRVQQPGHDTYFTRNGLLFLKSEELSALADRLARAEPLLASLAQQPNLTGLFDVLTLAMQEGGENADIAALLDNVADVAIAQTKGVRATLSWRELVALGGGRRQLVLAGVALDNSSLAPGGAALTEIRQIADRLGLNETNGITVRLTGAVALDYEELQSAALGGKTAGAISLLLVTVLLFAGLRSMSLILPAMITLLTGLVWTAAFATIAVGHLNLISVAFAVLFVGLGIDFSIHFCLRYSEALGEKSADSSPLGVAADVGGSLAIGAICAAVGFLAFLPTDYKGLAELGLISAGGMLIAFFTNVTLLPALLKVFPAPSRRPPGQRKMPLKPGTSRIIVLGFLVLGAAAAVVSFQARFDFNPMNLKDSRSESVVAFHDLAQDSHNGIYAIDLLTANRAAAKAAAERLRALPAVGSAVTLDSLVPGNQTEKLTIIEDIAFFLAPALGPAAADDSTAASRRVSAVSFLTFLRSYSANNASAPLGVSAGRAATALAALLSDERDDTVAELENRLVTHLPRMLDDLRQALNAEPVTVEDVPPQIRDSWIAADGRVRVQIRPAQPIKENSDLLEFAAAVLATAPTAVGTPITITEAGTAVVEAFREATLSAFVMVTIILLVVLRRLVDTILVLVPLILAAIFTGATSVLFDLPFNFANVIVLPLLFGLGVASGVHLVNRARHATDIGNLLETSTPRAVLFSALTTIASFGSLALSGHRGMTSMGQLLTIAIFYTLLCTLVFLPALMMWIERRAAR